MTRSIDWHTSRSQGMRSTYRLNSWTEPPSHRIDTLLTERLVQSGAFGQVASSAEGVRGTLVLSMHLEEIYHDAATSPGIARISLMAVLTDPAARSIVARCHFMASAPATAYDAAGAVQGFDRALGPLLDEVVAWAGNAAALRPNVAAATLDPH